jgi:hypothetical protein
VVDTNGGQEIQDTLPRRQRVGRVVLIAGAVLLVVAFFVPWMTLYVTYTGDVQGVGTYSPLVAVWRSVANGDLLAAGAVLGSFVVLLYCTIRLIARPQSQASRGIARVSAGLAVVCVCVTLLVLAFVVPGSAFYGLSLSWPFYQATIEYGALVGVVAFVVVAVGSAMASGVSHS